MDSSIVSLQEIGIFIGHVFVVIVSLEIFLLIIGHVSVIGIYIHKNKHSLNKILKVFTMCLPVLFNFAFNKEKLTVSVIFWVLVLVFLTWHFLMPKLIF